MRDPLLKLSQRIHYTFKDADTAKLALTHRSVGSANNERLEFLGDSILNFIIANELFKRFPDAKEGKLSRLRANLVKGETLAEIARDFELGDFLILGSGEMKSGGFKRDSILADTVEALIGAIYLESDMDTVAERVITWYQGRLDNLSLDDVVKDPKTRLQEYQQRNKRSLPKYAVVEVEGTSNDPLFTVSCDVAELDERITTQGSSRRNAEQKAAEIALNLIEQRTGATS